MAYEKKPNVVKRVAWHLVAKNLLKFVDDETSYKLTDKVLAANDFTKYPLSKGTLVEVGILDNTITYLRKQKSDAPKAESHGSEEAYEPTPEEEKGTVEPEKPKAPAPAEANPPIVDGGVRELTVFAVAANKRVVKFLECKDAGWFQIAEAIQAQDYATIGLIAKNKANVLITENTVMSFAKVASEATEQPKTATSSQGDVQSERIATPATQTPVAAPTAKKEWKPFSANKDDYWAKKSEFDQAHYDVKESEKQLSIEVQASVNAACDVVGKIAASISPAPTSKIVKEWIRDIATENYQLLQDLKKK